MFKLSVERGPLDPTQDLASAPTFSRLAHSALRADFGNVSLSSGASALRI
jgi:hypothetical protein